MTSAPLESTCPSCAGPLSIDADHLGRLVRCPHCRHAFTPSESEEVPNPALPTAAAPPGLRFNFQCRRCGSILEGRSDQSGQTGKCPTCEVVFTIPHHDPRTGRLIDDAMPADDEDPTPMHAYAAAGAKAPELIQDETGQWTIRCPRCGRASPIESINCGGCGLPFTLDGVTFQPQMVTNGYAVTSLVFGLLSLPGAFCVGLGILPGALAVVFGLLAASQMQGAQNAGSSRSLANAGLITGLIGTGLGGFVAWTTLL